MKLEVGKFYESVNGRKWQVIKYAPSHKYYQYLAINEDEGFCHAQFFLADGSCEQGMVYLSKEWQEPEQKKIDKRDIEGAKHNQRRQHPDKLLIQYFCRICNGWLAHQDCGHFYKPEQDLHGSMFAMEAKVDRTLERQTSIENQFKSLERQLDEAYEIFTKRIEKRVANLEERISHVSMACMAAPTNKRVVEVEPLVEWLNTAVNTMDSVIESHFDSKYFRALGARVAYRNCIDQIKNRCEIEEV